MKILSNEPKELNLKCILLLAMLYLTIFLISDSVAYKLIKIGPLLEPGPPFIFPLTYAIGDIMAEVYGSAICKRIIWFTLVCQFFYAFSVQIIIHLPSPPAWSHNEDYNFVFNNMVKFVFAGTLANLASNFVNVYIISKFKVMMKGRHFWVRGILSSAIGGIILIGIIVILGYAGEIGWKAAIRMFLSINILEFIYVFICVWPVWLIASILKRIEGIDVYESRPSLNPFRL